VISPPWAPARPVHWGLTMRTTRATLLLGALALACNGTLTGGGDPPGHDPVEEDPTPPEQAPEEVPLDPEPGSSSGVTLDGQGNLILDVDKTTFLYSHIWIANSPEGTVSKIDTKTGQEVARYRTGPGTPDPSRTTVGLDGDVVVANRGGASAVRISADRSRCIDRNGNGTIETSTGPTDVLPWWEDECVLWYTPFAGGSLARGAAFDFEVDPDGLLSSSVWIGLFNGQKLVRLDAETGAITAEVDTPGHCSYGLAFDGDKNLWSYSRCGARDLIRLDPATLTYTPFPRAAAGCDYGLAVDKDGRPWTAGGGCVARLDPGTGVWSTTSIGSSLRGLAHDGEGSVWIADTSYGVRRVDATTMAVLDSIPLSGGGFVGMAVDFDKQIWAVSLGGSAGHKIDPVTLASTPHSTGPNPYTYSDMTGYQLRNAAPPIGLFRAVVEGCGPDQQWHELHWKAETPPGTFVRFRARTGNSRDELDARPFVAVARQPSDASPADLQAALEAALPGSSRGKYLELELTLRSENAGFTPVVSYVGVTSTCVAILD
jgi:hypothetical protein